MPERENRVSLVLGLLILTLTLWPGCGGGNGSGGGGGNTPDFSLNISPSTQSMAADGIASFNLDVSFLNGFSSNVNLMVSGLPSGVSGAPAPNPLTHEGDSTLTLTGNGTATAGTHTFAVSATSGQITHSQNASVMVFTTPDFALSIVPNSQGVATGGSAIYTVTLTSENKYANTVTLSVSGLPPQATGSFNPQSLVPTGTSTLTVSTSSGTPSGTYNLTVVGSGGSTSHSISAGLTVGSTGAWAVNSLGNTGIGNNSVIVGPGRSDGISRVYVGTVNTGQVIEFSWQGSSWSPGADIGGSPSSQEIHNMGMGPGRNDGATRIYAASLDGNLYELSYNGTGWAQATVGTPNGGPATHAAVGPGRNDGVNRVYATRGAGVFEYTWNGTVWDTVTVGNVSAGLAHGLTIGPGRNDGINHLYVASTLSGTYEATFASGAWSLTSMGDSGDVRNVSVGPGRNDGTNRVYAGTAGGQVLEFTWNGSAWTFVSINNPAPDVLVHAYLLAGRNDGVMRVYASCGCGNVYEFTFNGSGWDTVTLTGASGYLYGMHFGAGRNDALNRLYVGSFSDLVYEYSWNP